MENAEVVGREGDDEKNISQTNETRKPPTIEEIENLIKSQYPKFQILNVYLFGSRLYQCHRESKNPIFFSIEL